MVERRDKNIGRKELAENERGHMKDKWGGEERGQREVQAERRGRKRSSEFRACIFDFDNPKLFFKH